MSDNIKNIQVSNIDVQVLGANLAQQKIESIEKSINNAFNNFQTAFCGDQECNTTAQKINVYALDSEPSYEDLLKEKGIDSSIKSHKYSALKDHENGEFDIYFYLDRSGNHAYSTLERAVARVIIESSDVFKKALTPAFKTGMVDYVSGLDESHNVQDNNEDCLDFNKIIDKNLTPHGILKSKNSEAQAEQVIKYLKQENPDKINKLFEDLTKTEDLEASKVIVDKFIGELKNDVTLNTKFSEWTNEQLIQFHQKLAEKFVPNIKSIPTEHGAEITIKYHEGDNKLEDIEKSITETLQNFKDTIYNGEEYNVPQKLNIFSFGNKSDCQKYLSCGNYTKLGNFSIFNGGDSEASIYLYPDKEGNSISTLKQWVVNTVIESNDLDVLPQAIREGIKNYILNLSDKSYDSSDFNQIKSDDLTPHNIMKERSHHHDLAGRVIEFFIQKKNPSEINELFQGLRKAQIGEHKEIVDQFIAKLAHYSNEENREFSEWASQQLNQINNKKSEDIMTQTQVEWAEPAIEIKKELADKKQDFIDEVMNSPCITELGIKPECKDKLQELVKALKECNEKSSESDKPLADQDKEKEYKDELIPEEPKEEESEDDKLPVDQDKPEEEEEIEEPEQIVEKSEEKDELIPEELKKQESKDEQVIEEPRESEQIIEESDESPVVPEDDKLPVDQDKPKEEEIEENGKNESPGISDIFDNLRKTLCGNQECHGAKQVNVSTISGDEFRGLTKSSSYDKLGHFIISNDSDTIDIKLYVDYEKESSVLDFGTQTFVNPHCSNVPSDYTNHSIVNHNYENEPHCSKAAQVMLFLEQRHHDDLVNFFRGLTKVNTGSECRDTTEQFIQELQNDYADEFAQWQSVQQGEFA